MEIGEQITLIKKYVKQQFQDDVTGHDYYHMVRVWNMAKIIAEAEGIDSFICEVSALTHDIGDHKLFKNPGQARADLAIYFATIGIGQGDIQQIQAICETVSYSKGRVPTTIEGKIVQDADRLDAIGAIGIARTFQYGGANGQLMYHPLDTHTSIQHFHDKLLKLRDLMHTNMAKQIARERHHVMEQFLERFYVEWNE